MAERRPRVLIVNAVALNAGDAAILMGEIEGLRRAFGGDVDVTVSDDAPEAAARLYPDIEFVPGLHHEERRHRGALAQLAISVRRRRISRGVRLLARSAALARRIMPRDAWEQVRRIAEADVVVATGGTYLVEHYPARHIRARTDELLAAQALGRPTVFYTQSLGPFTNRPTRLRVGSALRGASAVFVRDEKSRAHVIELGVEASRVVVRHDAAFALAPDAVPARSDASPGEYGGHRPTRVAVSVRVWRRFAGHNPIEGLDIYRQSVAECVRTLVDGGAEVEFVSTCQGVDDYWTDDSDFARALVDELLDDVPGVRVDTAFRRPHELVDHLRGFDLAIATRMHFAILALCAGIPVVPIAYEFKTTELFANLAMSELVRDIDSITPDSLVASVHDALTRRSELRARIAELLHSLRDDAVRPAVRVAELARTMP